jgi:hypothetical protein
MSPIIWTGIYERKWTLTWAAYTLWLKSMPWNYNVLREIGLCPIEDFDISGTEPFSSMTRDFRLIM